MCALRPGGTHIGNAQKGTFKIHSRLVAQASQPVQKRVEGRCSINDSQFFKMLFIKNIKMIFVKINPLSAQAGKPVPPDYLD